MQPLDWYIKRLRGMSPGEIAWRLRSAARDAADRARILGGAAYAGTAPFPCPAEREPGFRVSDAAVGEWAGDETTPAEAAWRRRLEERAERIASRRLSYFTLRDVDHGDPIDWNRDHESGKRAPLAFAPWIDYRDRRVAGDAKMVWEPNRHHHLVVLGRAYRAGGDRRYAEAVVEQLDSWMRGCPYGRGMNWRSPLELAIRLINWVWAIDLILESGLVSGQFRSRLLHSVFLHLREITRKYSRGSSANNHLIGEAAGVFVAAGYFRDLPGAEGWREESRGILENEIVRQTCEHGCNRELATGYHLFVLQFFLIAGVAAAAAGIDFTSVYRSRVEKMLAFGAALSEGGPFPMLGDDDEGYVLDLGGERDAGGLLAAGAVLFGRPDFKALARGKGETVRWLLGRAAWEEFEAMEAGPSDAPLASRAFPDSGHFLLQFGRRGSDEAVSVLFDCGELGYGSIAAHGHADALSFTVRAFGQEVFVDPGTYDYFTYPAWRDYFRSTRAHNTAVVDGADQSVMRGPFLWGRRAGARCVAWELRPGGGRVVGEHDGYTRLPDPVIHRRTLDLDEGTRCLSIEDEFTGRGEHEVAIRFHLSESCRLEESGGNSLVISLGKGSLILHIDPRLEVAAMTGSEAPIGGWVSRGYHRKVPAATVVARGTFSGGGRYACRLETGKTP